MYLPEKKCFFVIFRIFSSTGKTNCPHLKFIAGDLPKTRRRPNPLFERKKKRLNP
jgi:hypothetical protein